MDNFIGFHGGCSVKTLMDNLDEYKEEGKELVQVFYGSPKTLKLPPLEEVLSLYDRRVPVETIIHGPFVISLIADPATSLWQATLKYYKDLARICHVLGVKKIVTHIGGIRPYQDVKSGYYAIIQFCKMWLESTEGLDVTLCLENDAGSKTGRKLGSVTFLYKVIKDINDPRIRMCFDTEHAYANGLDLTELDKIDKILTVTSVVHLNGIPANVERGGHLDRHSETLIKDSKNGPDEIMNIARKAYDLGIPMILERKGEDIINADLKYVRGSIGSYSNIITVEVE